MANEAVRMPNTQVTRVARRFVKPRICEYLSCLGRPRLTLEDR
jgi:hypothetical protein